jgi:hypothetical protein
MDQDKEINREELHRTGSVGREDDSSDNSLGKKAVPPFKSDFFQVSI